MGFTGSGKSPHEQLHNHYSNLLNSHGDLLKESDRTRICEILHQARNSFASSMQDNQLSLTTHQQIERVDHLEKARNASVQKNKDPFPLELSIPNLLYIEGQCNLLQSKGDFIWIGGDDAAKKTKNSIRRVTRLSKFLPFLGVDSNIRVSTAFLRPLMRMNGFNYGLFSHRKSRVVPTMDQTYESGQNSTYRTSLFSLCFDVYTSICT